MKKSQKLKILIKPPKIAWGKKFNIIFVFMFLLACGDGTNSVIKPPPLPNISASLSNQNGVGLSGEYYLPTGYNTKKLPVLLAFHGTNYSSSYMIDMWRSLAEQYQFIIIAPDSNRNDPEWQIGNAGQITNDFRHTENCINEVSALNGVQFDYTKIISTGWSGGGWFSVYFATNNQMITAFANLHGGVTLDSVGTNIVPGFFSSGLHDDVCSPPFVHYFEDVLSQRGFSTIYTTFPGGHNIEKEERIAMINWWLNGVGLVSSN